MLHTIKPKLFTPLTTKSNQSVFVKTTTSSAKITPSFQSLPTSVTQVTPLKPSNKLFRLSARSYTNSNNHQNQSDSESNGQTQIKEFVKKWLAERPEHKKYSRSWWWEMFVICVVFAITGSSTMVFVRPFMKDVLNIEGTIKDGPWSYRFAYFGVMMPIYSTLLLSIGTVFGRYAYFKKFTIKMYSRFLPQSLLNKLK